MLSIFLFSCFGDDTNKMSDYEKYLNRSYNEQLGSDFYKRLFIFLKRGVSIDEVKFGRKDDIINPLTYSLRYQYFDTAMFFINNNAKVTYVDEYGNNSLMYAIYHSQWDIAKILIEKGSDVNIVNKMNDTPFDKYHNNTMDWAVRSIADLDFIKLLIEHGAKVSKRTLKYAIERKCSYPVIKLVLEKTIEAGYDVELAPYQRAVILNNDEEAVKKYLKDINISIFDDKSLVELGEMASCMASCGYINLLKLVKEMDFSMSISDDQGKSLLQNASENGEYETVKYLIKEGADINKVSYMNNELSALDYAVKGNHKDIVRLLADHKAKSNQWDIFQFAARYTDVEMLKVLKSSGYEFRNHIFQDNIIKNKNCIPMIKFFIDNGFDINKYDGGKGFTLLFTSLYDFADFKVLKWLIENGASPKIDKIKDLNPLNHAIEYGSYEKLAYLLNHGGVIDDKSLFQAVWSCDFDAVKLLVERGAKLNLRFEGNNVLHDAAFYGNEDIIEFLVSKGIKINEPNDSGDTPLHIACRENKFEAVMKLIELKADTGIKNKEGENAYEVAKYKSDIIIVDYFDKMNIK